MTARTITSFDSDFNVTYSARYAETRIDARPIQSGDLIFALIPGGAFVSLGKGLFGFFTKYEITALYRAFSAAEVRTLSAAAVRTLSNAEAKNVAKTLGFERVKSFPFNAHGQLAERVNNFETVAFGL